MMRECIEKARAENYRIGQEPPEGWRTIESAPTDGREIIGWGRPSYQHGAAMYPDARVMRATSPNTWSARNDFGHFTVGFVPTHWTPKKAGGGG